MRLQQILQGLEYNFSYGYSSMGSHRRTQAEKS
jgi:hypothetical protein